MSKVPTSKVYVFNEAKERAADQAFYRRITAAAVARQEAEKADKAKAAKAIP